MLQVNSMNVYIIIHVLRSHLTSSTLLFSPDNQEINSSTTPKGNFNLHSHVKLLKFQKYRLIMRTQLHKLVVLQVHVQFINAFRLACALIDCKVIQTSVYYLQESSLQQIEDYTFWHHQMHCEFQYFFCVYALGLF